MNVFVGADPEHLDQLATGFEQAADRVLATVVELERATASTPWRGIDADDFIGNISRLVRPRVQSSVDLLQAEAATLRREAHEQRQASRGDGAGATLASIGAGAVTGAPASRPLPEDLVLRFETATPAERRSMWRRFDADTRERFITQHPALVGNTDGIPFEDRYRANHLLVERDWAAAEAVDPEGKHTAALAFLRDQQVVVYQPGQGRVATVEGNIATAKNVAVFVPGTSSSFDDFPGGTNGTWDKAHQIRIAADRAAGDDTAVVAWLGYDAPPALPDAARGDRASAGALLLTSFTTGIGLGGRHLTLVGHSYGSTVIGYGMLDGAPAQDVVVLGSPGMGVDHEADLHLPAGGHVYAERASRDPVSDLEAFGNDPSMPTFGGVRMTTNGAEMPDVTGHSRYFTPESVSVANIGRVVAGQPPLTQSPSLGDWVADVTDVPAPGEQAMHQAAVGYHGPGDFLLRGVDRADRGLHGGVEALERNVVDNSAEQIGGAIDKGEELIAGVGDFLTGPWR